MPPIFVVRSGDWGNSVVTSSWCCSCLALAFRHGSAGMATAATDRRGTQVCSVCSALLWCRTRFAAAQSLRLRNVFQDARMCSHACTCCCVRTWFVFFFASRTYSSCMLWAVREAACAGSNTWWASFDMSRCGSQHFGFWHTVLKQLLRISVKLVARCLHFANATTHQQYTHTPTRVLI